MNRNILAFSILETFLL